MLQLTNDLHSIDVEDLMAEGDSPTVARRRVRMALRVAREAAGKTQLEVAEAMEWSHSKYIRIENGDVSIAPNDLKPLLAFLDIRDKAEVAELMASAKVSRTRQRKVWFQSPEFREHLTDPMRKLVEFEAEANLIHLYSVFHVPGQLQIPEYAAALMDTWSGELPAEQIRIRLASRKRRRDALLARAGSLHITALLDESVFRRTLGHKAVLKAQLNELIRLSDEGFLSVRVIRFTADLPMSYNAGFDVLFLGDEGDLSKAVMYRETGTTDEILEDTVPGGRANVAIPPTSGPVARHYERYQKLWDAATHESDTITFIRERMDELT